MGRFMNAAAFATALLPFISTVLADSSLPSCGPGKACPAESPCCSQYGQCGIGAFCLGGCDPLFSFDLNSCVPAATCKSNDYKLSSLDDVQPIDQYLGDYSKINWVASGNPAAYSQGDTEGVLLTLSEGTSGTLMATTHYVWYGKVSATLTTSQGAGVVTAFILMSDVKDEIDFEFVGVDTHHAQSNFYSQGVTNYNNGMNLSVTGDTVSQAHTYTIDWQPDTLTWAVDGKVMRTLNRDDTWNSTANRFDYPQTPARVMLSLWPAGLPSNGEGTIEWSGGEISWDSPYMSGGYYSALFSDVNVECYDPPSGAQIDGSKSYIYTDAAGTNNTVKITDDMVILKSLYASGDNPNECPDCASSTKGGSKPTASAKPSTQPATVPGEVGTGSRGDSAGSAASGAAGSQSTGSSGGSSSSFGGGSSTFEQGDSSDGSSGAAGGFESKMASGSALAVVIALAAVLMI